MRMAHFICTGSGEFRESAALRGAQLDCQWIAINGMDEGCSPFAGPPWISLTGDWPPLDQLSFDVSLGLSRSDPEAVSYGNPVSVVEPSRML